MHGTARDRACIAGYGRVTSGEERSLAYGVYRSYEHRRLCYCRVPFMSQPTRAEVAALLKKAAEHRRKIQGLENELQAIRQKIERTEARRRKNGPPPKRKR